MNASASTICLTVAFTTLLSSAYAEESLHGVRDVVSQNCYDCHSGPDSEGALDLEKLNTALNDQDTFDAWAKVFDRVAAGEMPPKDYGTLTDAKTQALLEPLKKELESTQLQQFASVGRVQARRLTNLQLERSLHDVLGIDVPLAVHMPDETKVGGFTTVARGQSMSHFQLEQHLDIVDRALDEAFRRATTEPDEFHRELTAREIARRNPRRRCREPEMIGDDAVVWSSRLIFYGRLPVTTAREDGWYRFTVRASALNKPKDFGVWCTLRTGPCVSSAPLLGWAGALEVTNEPQEWTFEAWLPKGHMFELRPGDGTLKMGRFAGGQVGAGEGGPQNLAGIAIHSAVLERIHHGPNDQQIRNWLFGDLKLQQKDRRSPSELVSDSPNNDIARLLTRFADRAFRRPVSDSVIKPYIEIANQDFDQNKSLLSALRTGYRAILCSPRFLYFEENMGDLDEYALATRLSYFLWNSPPDEELLQLAGNGKLRDADVLTAQINRMLDDERGQSFVKDFAAEWLDLDQIDFTEPDRRMFPSFDIIVQQSMLNETHQYLQSMLNEDRSVTELVDSNYSFLNSRLARFYRIDDVHGDGLQKVSFRPKHHRGGLLTHGSVLKVTANGTNTSPVIRGVWISDRLLGKDIPPPPKSVPAIEPDIRGASTIREMLAKHRSDASCASCHLKIDPPGFALENYDPSGQWRDNYPIINRGRRGKGPAIDASYDLGEGRQFDNINGFQEMVLAEPDQLARNVAKKMLTYGTGAPIAFSDRPEIDSIAAKSASSNYGLRTILTEVVHSRIFQTK